MVAWDTGFAGQLPQHKNITKKAKIRLHIDPESFCNYTPLNRVPCYIGGLKMKFFTRCSRCGKMLPISRNQLCRYCCAWLEGYVACAAEICEDNALYESLSDEEKKALDNLTAD